ncbi:DoxX family protein [Granulosicoccaceae sp. 1_MG-2023]|nr:DoxX family protein [Granulosicoccaceae sp. 1_MG-2023]
MTKQLNSSLLFLSRFLFTALFLPAGIGKLTDFSGTVAYIESAGMPLAALDAVVAMLVEILCALALLLGFRTPLASMILALFTFMAAVVFHPYWAVAPDQLVVTQQLFFKNMAIIGGLFALAASGPGAWAIAARTPPR